MLGLASALLLASCAHKAEPDSGAPALQLVRRSQPLLGTFVTITAYGADEAALSEAVNSAFAQFREADRLMSVHREDSELADVNRRAAEEPLVVSPELFEVLQLAHEISKASDGAFDVTLRPVLDLWGFIWKEQRFPDTNAIAAALSRVDWTAVRLDPRDRSVRFLRPGISIDLGGIGKGKAVDMAVAELQRRGVAAAMVKAGGDLRVFGAPPGAGRWSVQIEDPSKQGKRAAIPLRDAALSTSGNYENFFIHAGRRYSHILDPRTGWPVQGVASCAVIAPTCAESDAWATALFILGPQRAAAAGAHLDWWFILEETNQSGSVVYRSKRSSQFPEPEPSNVRPVSR